MTDGKYSNDPEMDCYTFKGEEYVKVSDMKKYAVYVRHRALEAAVAALPEKHKHFYGCWQDESPWKAEHYSNTNTRNRTIDQMESNLKALIGGDV